MRTEEATSVGAMLVRISLAILATFVLAIHWASAEELGSAAAAAAPISQRFSDGKTPEEPSFQRHVSPLLGRLGCNGRACHGSFQGQGGFRLSLFGFDFQADHA